MREAGIEWKIRKPRTSNAQIFAALPKKPKHTPWYRPNTRIECPHCEKPTDVPAQEFFYQYSREYTCTECGKRFEVFIDIMALEK